MSRPGGDERGGWPLKTLAAAGLLAVALLVVVVDDPRLTLSTSLAITFWGSTALAAVTFALCRMLGRRVSIDATAMLAVRALGVAYVSGVLAATLHKLLFGYGAVHPFVTFYLVQFVILMAWLPAAMRTASALSRTQAAMISGALASVVIGVHVAVAYVVLSAGKPIT